LGGEGGKRGGEEIQRNESVEKDIIIEKGDLLIA
jgi:hypothetical protein